MALNLFGSSKTDSSTTNNVDNSYSDSSVNTNNEGAILTGGGDVTFSDQGAIEAAVDLGFGAFGLSEDLVNSALKSNQSAMDLSLQTARGAIDKSLAVAAETTRSDGKELIQNMTKIGLAIAAVLGVGLIVGRK